ncbi:MAG: glycosyltransferase family 2 protein [Elusimicrobiaceae bacterium]|nr:glycosyltransferase family 2 protein [Elusimicrobiaceae bacterium]
MDKKISVIIPVYNVRPDFIETAINSVLNQTYKNIEIIVVDDGSTEKETLDYLQTLNHPTIKLIHQENKGLGGARNTGINHATGDYIGFLDADDWLSPNYYEVLYKLCEENNAGVACAILTRVIGDVLIPMEAFNNTVITDFVEKMKYITNGSVCSKLFKKELFLNVRFEEHSYFEDNPVLVETFAKSSKVAYTNTVRYYYRETSRSITLNPTQREKRRRDGFRMLQRICNLLNGKTQREKDVALSAFAPLLIDPGAYNAGTPYRKEVEELLGENFKQYLGYVNIPVALTGGSAKPRILRIPSKKFKFNLGPTTSSGACKKQ